MAFDHLDGQVADAQRDAVTLLVSELVTNSVLHGDGHCQLSVELQVCGCVRVEARDKDPSSPQHADAAVDVLAEQGRGLLLVDGLAEEWGHYATEDGGKVVWCKVPGHDDGG